MNYHLNQFKLYNKDLSYVELEYSMWNYNIR